jgi:hypothetical protein
MIADHPIHLDAEQVMLTGQQVACGIQEDLWQQPPPNEGDRAVTQTVARLLPAGRALNFDDDVIIGEAGYVRPYVQVRGDFPTTLGDGPDVREPEQDVRMVTGKLMISIPHMCFPDPLPVMGVRKGKFSEDTLPTMRFELRNDGWHYDKLVH